jgi:transcriptional regulator with XRE-family HTH domain
MLLEVKRVKRATVCIMPFWKEGMTVEKVAKDLEVNPRTVSGLRRGTNKGDWSTLLNCARYFNVPVEALIRIDEEENDEPSSVQKNQAGKGADSE